MSGLDQILQRTCREACNPPLSGHLDRPGRVISLVDGFNVAAWEW